MFSWVVNRALSPRALKRRARRQRARMALYNHRWLLPHACTLMNGFLGFCAMIAAIHGNIKGALVAVAAGAVFDALDGRVARMTGFSSPLGVQLDSLCDAVTFCCTPALMVYVTTLHTLGPVGICGTAIYLLAGVVRLARFNLTADIPTPHFVGLPVPAAACTLLALAYAIQPRPGLLLCAALGIAWLMVSKVPFTSGKYLSLKFVLRTTLVYLATTVFLGIRLASLCALGSYLLYHIAHHLWQRTQRQTDSSSLNSY